MAALDLDSARETFESSTDFTVGLEEEFAIVNPATLELEHRFEDLYEACQGDEVLAESAAGELIASEIEIRSGRSESFAHAVPAQADAPRAPPPRPPTPASARNSAGSPSATTPGACTPTWGCEAPIGRSPSATGCGSCCRCCSRPPATRPSSIDATPGGTPSA